MPQPPCIPFPPASEIQERRAPNPALRASVLVSPQPQCLTSWGSRSPEILAPRVPLSLALQPSFAALGARPQRAPPAPPGLCQLPIPVKPRPQRKGLRLEGAPGGGGCERVTGADVGEAEQLGCGRALREGISPDEQLRQKCLLWGRGERGGRGGGRREAGPQPGVLGLRLHPACNRLQATRPRGQRLVKSLSQMTPEVARGGNELSGVLCLCQILSPASGPHCPGELCSSNIHPRVWSTYCALGPVPCTLCVFIAALNPHCARCYDELWRSRQKHGGAGM